MPHKHIADVAGTLIHRKEKQLSRQIASLQRSNEKCVRANSAIHFLKVERWVPTFFL